MNNTILLIKTNHRLTIQEWKKYKKGDAIWGYNSNPEILARWSINDIDTAKRELNKYRCHYDQDIELYNITEYALEYCEYNDSGEFISGSDYDLAEEIDL